MGGVKRFPFPKWVFSPTGGWWNEGSHKNTGFRLMGTIAAIVAGWAMIFKISIDNERRSIPIRPAPSQRWCKHTLEDDPDYLRKFEEYHRTKPSLWERIKPDPEHH